MNDYSGDGALYGAKAGALLLPGAVPRPAMVQPGAPMPGVATMIDKLAALIEHETNLLRGNAAFDLNESNFKKSQALLDLTRGLRVFETKPMGQDIAARLKQLAARLEENRNVLRMHMEAVREVAAIMTDELRRAESDGTYVRPCGNAGAAQ